MLNFLEKMFSLKKENGHKIITLFGIKIRFRYGQEALMIKKMDEYIIASEQRAQQNNDRFDIINSKLKQFAARLDELGIPKKPIQSEKWNIPDYLKNTLVCEENNLSELGDCIEVAGVKISTTESHWGLAEIFGRRDYEFGGLGDTVFIDIGANIGDSTLYAALQQSVSKVYAYEPFPNTYSALNENVELNPQIKEKIEISDFGWSDKNETLQVKLYDSLYSGVNTIEQNFVDNFVAIQTDNIVPVKIRKSTEIFDGILAKHPNQPIILKMDVEGSEYKIIEDLEKSDLLKYVDMIFCEWHYQGYKNITDVLERNNYIWFNEKFDAEIGFIRAYNPRKVEFK